jgi:hypothetical protein
MNRDSQLTRPPAPNLIGAIRSGFDAVTNQILLILFPIFLDLLLWFGPRIKLTGLINSISEDLFMLSTSQDPGLAEILEPMQVIWSQIAENFNMLTFLRSYPVGITSLIVAELPDSSPVGVLGSLEIGSPGGVFLAFILISLAGLTAGTLYFLAVAQAAAIGDISWPQAFSDLPWTTLQVIFLAILWISVLLIIAIPGSLLVSLVVLSGVSYGTCAMFIFAGFVFWLILPLVFSPHGIVMKHENVFQSVKLSINLTRRTLPSTVLFVLAAFLLSKGLDILWLAPDGTSWLLLVGIAGHAFVTTGLLAASFVYYRDALRWMQEMVKFRNLEII